ncbi:MAG TPA: hypothetical protein VF172_11760 [Nitrososphaera sp.]|jgi:hypothetical protein
MSEREEREQIPTEFNAEKGQNALRKRDRVEGEQRDKTVIATSR